MTREGRDTAAIRGLTWPGRQSFNSQLTESALRARRGGGFALISLVCWTFLFGLASECLPLLRQSVREDSLSGKRLHETSTICFSPQKPIFELRRRKQPAAGSRMANSVKTI